MACFSLANTRFDNPITLLRRGRLRPKVHVMSYLVKVRRLLGSRTQSQIHIRLDPRISMGLDLPTMTPWRHLATTLSGHETESLR